MLKKLTFTQMRRIYKKHIGLKKVPDDKELFDLHSIKFDDDSKY